MTVSKNFAAVVGLVYITLIIGGIVGWVKNIMLLLDMNGFSGFMAARIAGIVVPFVGAILGWIPN